MKGRASLFCSRTERRMAAISAGTLRKVPRRRRMRVISAKKRSTRFNQEAPVGVKWN